MSEKIVLHYRMSKHLFFAVTNEHDYSQQLDCISFRVCGEVYILRTSVVLIDPVGEVVVEEGHNVTLTCTSNVKGATLLLVKANIFSSPSLVARAEGMDFSHTFFFVRGSDVGRYWCTLQSRVATSEDVELVVTGTYVWQ